MKERLLADYKQRMVRLRDREMQLIVTQANGLSMVFALITGVMADSMYTGYCEHRQCAALAPMQPVRDPVPERFGHDPTTRAHRHV